MILFSHFSFVNLPVFCKKIFAMILFAVLIQPLPESPEKFRNSLKKPFKCYDRMSIILVIHLISHYLPFIVEITVF
jgi:hypothetical protein